MTNIWIQIAATSDIDDEEILQIRLGEKMIALYQLGDRYYATDDICTHEYACLSDGFVVDGKIECPLHQGLFDIRSGKAQGPPVEIDLETFQTKVEDGHIFILL